MQTLLPEHPPYPECNMIHFQIDESVAHSQIPKLWGQIRNLQNCGGAGRKM